MRIRANELRQMPYAGWSHAIAISGDGRDLASSGRDVDLNTSIEVTEIWPTIRPPHVRASGAQSHARRVARQYLGESEPYRETCPGAGAAKDTD
jgi:hypothetical protein